MRIFAAAYAMLAASVVAACGAESSRVETPTITPQIDAAPEQPDAAPPGTPDGASPTNASSTSDAAAEPRFVVKGDEVYDRRTGLTWYSQHLYGSKSVDNSNACDLTKLSPPLPGFRRATVAETLSIVDTVDGRWVFPDEFVWSSSIPSQAADGCLNTVSAKADPECEGDLINVVCARR